MMFGEKYIPYEILKKRATEMRKNPTGEERKMWFCLLRGFTPDFHRQRVMNPYIVDFCCPKLKLVIEIDGCQHAELENILYEEKRTNFIEKKGYVILRFDNYDVNYNFDDIKYEVKTFCEKRAKELGVVFSVDTDICEL